MDIKAIKHIPIAGLAAAAFIPRKRWPTTKGRHRKRTAKNAN